jgi:acyl-CoA thioesterase FadM
MYPFLRLLWQFHKHRNDPALAVTGTHISRHICWPWDLDVFAELNNGRVLTLYDMGRFPMSRRMGLMAVLKQQRWGLAVAGVSVRYRRRVKAFERITMRSRGICWDARFFYIEQSMWAQNGDCASHILLRTAVTGAKGIIPPPQVLAAMGQADNSPAMPEWVAAWSGADAQRPWPPMQDA